MTGESPFGELRTHWRALLACSLGLGSGLALHPFVMSVLAPYLLAAMQWSKAEFAGVAAVSGLTILAYPLGGRIADRFGVRAAGGIGLAAMVAGYGGLAMLGGSIRHYAAILIVQVALGAMTTGPVYLRLIVRAFDRSRGLALAIAVAAPAIVASVASPMLAGLIEAEGWRAGVLAVMAWTLIGGVVALAMVPPSQSKPDPARALPVATAGFRGLVAHRPFRMLALVTVLVSMPLVLTNSQLALVLVDNGMTAAKAGGLVGLFAAGTIGGRLAAGLALDRFSAVKVGALALSLPAAGMLLIASPLDQPAVLGLAILLIGVAFGAEGDVLAYIAARWFAVENYGVALGSLFAAAGLSGAIGAMALSATLDRWGSYVPFLLLGSVSVVLGSALLLRIREPDAPG